MRGRHGRVNLPILDEEDAATHEELAELDAIRPRTRGDCVDGPRPCPWVGCRHHLYLEVSSRTGRISVPHGEGVEPWDLAETCSLDVADVGEQATSGVVGELLGGFTRARVDQVEAQAKRRMAPRARRIDPDAARDCEGPVADASVPWGRP